MHGIKLLKKALSTTSHLYTQNGLAL